MKHFKLIKTYPGSPDLGVIVRKDENNYMDLKEYYSINPIYVENNPEFWEELPEYVKCVCEYNKYGVVGRIYKIIDGRYESYIEVECNIECGGYNPGKSLYFNYDAFVPSTEKEYLKQLNSYPVGTKIRDTYPETEGYTYEKLSNGRWKMNSQDYYTISESSIGEGKRFQVIEESFTLPEKWCVENLGTDDYQCLIDYANKYGASPKYFLNEKYYYHFPNNKWTVSNKVEKDYTKITLEQFKKYVLGEESKKHYEILSFTDGFNINNRYGEFFSINTQHYYKEEDLLKNPNWKIHSIKRLSDGEVFTIGNKAKSGVSDHICTIEELRIRGNTIYVSTKEKLWGQEIKNLKKVKPLFTTEDGVDIYKGDDYYWINPGNKYFDHEWEIKYISCEYGGANIDQVKEDIEYGLKNFSTKEAAEKYILMNKSCLNVKDLEEVLHYDQYLKVIKIVESKLK